MNICRKSGYTCRWNCDSGQSVFPTESNVVLSGGEDIVAHIDSPIPVYCKDKMGIVPVRELTL
jgi:hypothetical protein